MQIIEQQLIDLLPHYESFFNRVGFKRIDGAVFGLLCFSESALTSEQIEQALGLSQSAVSQSLKTLAQYSMIDCKDHTQLKRKKLHYVKEDALTIVASVLQKREAQYLSDFENMTSQALQVVTDPKRTKRLTTIAQTTKFARALTDIIINVNKEVENPYPVMAKLPLFMSFMKSNVPTITQAKEQVKSTLKNKLNGWLSNIEEQTKGEVS